MELGDLPLFSADPQLFGFLSELFRLHALLFRLHPLLFGADLGNGPDSQRAGDQDALELIGFDDYPKNVARRNVTELKCDFVGRVHIWGHDHVDAELILKEAQDRGDVCVAKVDGDRSRGYPRVAILLSRRPRYLHEADEEKKHAQRTAARQRPASMRHDRQLLEKLRFVLTPPPLRRGG